MITWRPIAELPDELKDGRRVLVWTCNGYAHVVEWADWGEDWRNDEMLPIDGPTHFAEINAPGGQSNG